MRQLKLNRVVYQKPVIQEQAELCQTQMELQNRKDGMALTEMQKGIVIIITQALFRSHMTTSGRMENEEKNIFRLLQTTKSAWIR